MKIQSTTISERQDGKARLDIEISDSDDLEQSSEFVALSLLIDLNESAAYRLEWIQSRALTKAAQIIGEAADKCDSAVSRSQQ